MYNICVKRDFFALGKKGTIIIKFLGDFSKNKIEKEYY